MGNKASSEAASAAPNIPLSPAQRQQQAAAVPTPRTPGAETIEGARTRVAADTKPSPLDTLASAKKISGKDERSPLEAARIASTAIAGANDMDRYERFRDELMSFMLGEAAYDYAERLYADHPDDPSVMAFLGETVWKYEHTKVKARRAHWVDRMDLLQRGIDVTRRCMREHPEFGPCFRAYTLCAVKAADSVYYWRWMRGVGVLEHYHGIMKKGERAMDLTNDFEVTKNLAMLTGRCAQDWNSPYRVFGKWYGIPPRREMLQRALGLHKRAFDIDPLNVENACRVAMTMFELGEFNDARRWYVRVRDEMAAENPGDEVWQSVAHTHLCMRFAKTRWNATSG